MGLKKVTGTRVVVDLREDVRQSVDPPAIVVYDPARAFFKALALDLLGLTALTGANHLAAVQAAAAALDEADDVEWTQTDARKILAAVGTIPAPSHVQVVRLKGEGTLLFRAVRPDAPRARQLSYTAGSRRAQITLLAALRPEGIAVPKGMAMAVPVKLVEDEYGLALAAYFRRGKLRDATEEPEEEASPT